MARPRDRRRAARSSYGLIGELAYRLLEMAPLRYDDTKAVPVKIDHELTDGEFDVMSISITEASQLGVASGRFQMGATYNRLFHGRGGPLDHPMHGYATIDFMERLVPHRPR